MAKLLDHPRKKGVGKVKVHLSHDQCTLIREEMAKCPGSKAVWA